MAYRIDDPYNQGIGTPDLGNMNLGQVPLDNMQQANWLNTISGGMMGTTAEQDAENTALEQIQEIRKNQFEGYPSGTNPAWVEEYKGDYPDLYEKYQDKQKQIQDLKKQFPQNIDIQQASLDDDFGYNEYGYPKTAMIDPFSLIGMAKAGMSKKEIAKYLVKEEVKKAAIKKFKPVFSSNLTGGPTQTTPGGYTGPQTQDFNPQQFAKAGRRADKPGGFTDPGKDSYGPHKAYGGRVSYFDGGLASLWLR